MSTMQDSKAEILDILREDARTPAEQIAKMVGSNIVDVAAAIDEMEKDRILVKYTVLVDGDKLDASLVDAIIEVKVTPQREMGFDALAEQIYRFDEVKSVYLMSGAYDLMVQVEGSSMKDVAMFVSRKLATIENVLSTATHFVLKKYKCEGVIFGETKEDDRLVVTA